jgi:hypothetical protein
MAERPDDDTLRLLCEVVEEIGTSEAVEPGAQLFGMTVEMADGLMRTTYHEPPPKVLRHLLDRLRHLDMPTSDIRLERVFPILDRTPMSDEWRASLETAKAAYRKAQTVTNNRVQQPDEPPPELLDHEPTWILPREAFGLWAYGGVIHHDYAKEQKWARLGIAQGAVRLMGHDYALMLLDEAEFMARLLRFGVAGPPSPPLVHPEP